MGEPSDYATIEVAVQPGARTDEVVGRHGDGWKVRVTAPPADGKANEAVVALLARTLGVHRRDVTISAGHTSRRKRVRIEGLDAATVARRLG